MISTGYVAGGGMNLSYQLTPWVKKLLIANTVIFILTWVIGREGVEDWFSFRPSEMLVRPWGVVSYMFLHGDFWHLFGNMLVLFFFGPPLESKWGSNEFIKYYMICGLGGVALSFFFVSYSIIGASAAVYGIMLAFAMAWPEAPIYIWGIFPVKAKWLVAFFFLINFTSAFGGAGGGVAHFAHLGGFITGFLYLKTDWKAAEQIQRMGRAARARRFAIVPRDDNENEEEAAGGRRGRDREAEERESTMLDAVDKVLDKISAEGMGALTEAERRLLDEVSRKHRTN